ncbi:phytanoyl-CoA dioxygenase family protein [Candidatus Poribacteria bacterium]|nr:phytanoyl-CoA dioxygenase family protein [Candidatus Poribacteria bacterium]
MLNHTEIQSFLENGYVIRRGVLSQRDIETYRAAVDRILYKCRIEKAHQYLRHIDGEKDDIWGVNNIFHPSIREHALVESVGHPQILGVIEDLIGTQLRYHLCTLLVSSEQKPYHINWHRDSARDGEVPLERLLARLKSHVQLNGALYDDETLYIVPGSHRREITDAEREILRNSPKADMPNQMAVKLQAGDIVFYNSSLLHKGYNKSGAKRQTLHYALIVAPPEDEPPNPESPTSQEWLNNPEFLDNLSPRIKPLFDNWLKYG